MTIQVTYTHVRENLAQLWDEVTQNLETVIVTRQGADDIALISATELASLQETAYLLRSPANADCLLNALKRSQAGEGKPQTIDELRTDLDIEFLQARYHY